MHSRWSVMAVNATTASITINYTASFTTVYQEIFVNLQIVNGDLFNFSERIVVDSPNSSSQSFTHDTARDRERDDEDDCTRICLSWEKMLLVVLFCTLIVITVIGNTLVILSVATTRRLRTVTNCFVMSLAVADWLVGIFVMPPAVMLFVVGKYLKASVLPWYLRSGARHSYLSIEV